MRLPCLITLAFSAALAAGGIEARERDGNPPGPRGGPGTNWENPPGWRGGPGTSPDRRTWRHHDRDYVFVRVERGYYYNAHYGYWHPRHGLWNAAARCWIASASCPIKSARSGPSSVGSASRST